MKKNNQLPESLELLLDTMCNTFGGVMFIAIALIVISQLLIRSSSAAPEEAAPESRSAVQQRVAALEEELAAMRREWLSSQERPAEMNAEQALARRRLLTAVAENARQSLELERLDTCIQAEGDKCRQAQAELDLHKDELQQQEQQQQAKRRRLEAQITEEQNRLAQLEEELSHAQPRELRFAMAESTSLAPYWVLLAQGRIHRLGLQSQPLFGEVALQDSPDGSYAHMVPLRGITLGENPEQELEQCFRSASRLPCFISLVVDNQSFLTLLTVKQYLRNHGFQVNWSFNPEFKFTYASRVDYQSSQ